MVDSTNATLTAYSYVALVVFLLVVVLVVRPIKIRLHRRIKIYLNIATVPPLGVLILLICQAISFDVVKKGFLGTLGVQPWGILILFYSLAYICISLDMTGVFQYCAFWVSRKAGDRGMLAFTLFFILTSLMSGLTSNDVVILTGTVFLAYFTKVSDIDPTAFLMSEFTTANIASMALYIGNPTNVVVSEAYNISFITYSAWMLLPTVFSIMVAYIVLRLTFRSQKYIPRKISPPDAEPASVLIDPWGAIFGLVILACCLLTLVGTSFANVPVWMITLPFGCVMLIRDFLYDLGFFKWVSRKEKTEIVLSIQLESQTETHALEPVYSRKSIESAIEQSGWFDPVFRPFASTFPTLMAVALRMPWSILPFSLGMFILIEALAELGWVGLFAKGLAVFAKNYATAVLGTMFVSIIACQILNNLPMTILFTQILQHPNFTQHIHSEATLQGFLLGLIAGSNLGACFTLVGSLAGIMFDHILKTKGILTLGYFQFLKWNLIILPAIALTASAVIIGEIWFVYIK